jgi:hypothetical protein
MVSRSENHKAIFHIKHFWFIGIFVLTFSVSRFHFRIYNEFRQKSFGLALYIRIEQ